MGRTLLRWVIPSVVGPNPPLSGRTLRCRVVPSVVRSYPPLSGRTLRCRVVPSVVGSLPPSLGQTLRRWAKPSFCASSLHLHSASSLFSASSLPLVIPRPLVILPSSYAVVVALRSYLRRHFHTDASALGSSHLHLRVFRHIGIGFDPRTFVSFYASASGSILTPSCLSTHRRWDPYTFASFDMSVLGSLHLRLSTRRCWILIPLCLPCRKWERHAHIPRKRGGAANGLEHRGGIGLSWSRGFPGPRAPWDRLLVVGELPCQQQVSTMVVGL